jgi:hypothetical protein
MSRRLLGAVAVAALVLGATPGWAFGQDAAAQKARKDARAFAQRIDKIITKRLAEEKVQPGPKADDATFVRRLHIDMVGKIPTLLEAGDFIDPTNDSPDKLDDRLDDLLSSPAFVTNWAHYWRSVMLTGTNNVQASQFNFQFEGWLRNRLQSNTGYDKMAHEIITSQNGGGGGFGPQAFYFVNENKAENLAGATARVFLGVKIECAQCHKHPFAKWTRNQFWEYAAFFAGVQQQQPRPGKGGGVPFDPNGRKIQIPETDTIVEAKFITGDAPDWTGPNKNPRTVLADWMTSSKNPYFARAAVDHVWQYFFGVSLCEPIFEPTDDAPPAHPELLDELAKSFIESGYDLKFLIRAIVQTEAYQRASVALSQDTKEQIQLFARMPVRGMMPEQLFDCFAEATGYEAEKNPNDPNRQVNQFGVPSTPRAIFLAKFTSQDKRIETQTSILQALYLMNGKFLAERTKLENNKSLETIATQPTSHARRVETLYKMTLSRMPRSDELAKMVRYIETSPDPRQAVADVYWALLNSSEFALNH